MLKRILLTFIFFSAVVGAYAQHSLHVYGKVTDANNNPMDMVDVMVKGTTTGTSTDSVGKYSLNVSTSDSEITLKFQLLGYENVEKKVKTDKSEVKLNVTMSDSIMSISDVTIQDYSRQSDNMQKLGVSTLKEVPNANGSIEAVLTTQAGVSTNNELSSQYSVRGGNYDENCVYVNHVEVYRPMLIRAGQQEGLSFVNPDMVGAISFSSGGYGVEYGDKMASVLDIEYKQPQKFEGSVSASLLGASAYVGSKLKKFSQMHGFRYKSNKNLINALNDVTGEYDPKFFDYQTYLTFDFNPKWQLAFLGNISRNSYKFVPENRYTKFGTMSDAKELQVYFDGQEKDLFLTYFGDLALKYKPSKDLELQFTGSTFYNQENVTYDISSEYFMSDVDGSNSLYADYGKGIGTFLEHARDRLHSTVSNISHYGKYRYVDNQLKWGLTLQHEYVNEHMNEWEMHDSVGYSMPYNEDALSLYYNLFSEQSVTSNRVLAYVMDHYTFRPSWARVVVSGGLRMNYWTFNDEVLVSPRAAVAIFPSSTDKWAFRLSGGRYFQSPFYKEMRDTTVDEQGNATVSINKNIKAQRSTQLLFGTDCYFKMWERPFKFTTEVYGKYIDRLIPYTVDNVKIVYEGENNGDAYVVGLDTRLFGEFIPGTDSWVSFSTVRAKENIYGDGEGYISRPTDQRYNFSMFFQDYLPGHEKFKVNIKLIWSDGLTFGPPHSERKYAVYRSRSYRRVDLGATYELVHGRDQLMDKFVFKYFKKVALGLDLLNLFDIKNVNSYYWISTVNGNQYAVPNYLTSRQVNFRLIVDF